MKTPKQTLDTILYTYDPTEFLPIFYNGKLYNRNEFIQYKAKKTFVCFSNIFDKLAR